MGCASSTQGTVDPAVHACLRERLDALERRLNEKEQDGLSLPTENSTVSELSEQASSAWSAWSLEQAAPASVFVSHAKRLSMSEDKAVWVADVCETAGHHAFFDRSDLQVISEAAIEKAMLSSDVCVTILDPHSFESEWVLRENAIAAKAGIPIILAYDSDRFRFEGELDKWLHAYPWAFRRQVIPVSKHHRRSCRSMLLDAMTAAACEGRGAGEDIDLPTCNEELASL